MEVTNSMEPARKWSKGNQAIYDPDGQNLQLTKSFENTEQETSCWERVKNIFKSYLSLILIIIVLLLSAVGIGIYFGGNEPGKY